MIKVTIEEFQQGKLENLSGEHKIYLVRDGECILYVGRSIHIPQRMKEHLSLHNRLTADEIGDLFWENKPQSWNWHIEVLTLEDCLPIVSQLYPVYNTSHLPDESTAELALIIHHHPCINAMNNVSPGVLPEHIKVYKLQAGKTDNRY